jgi:hypothetical protein
MHQLRWLESVTRDLLKATAAASTDIRNRIFAAMAEVESTLENDAEFVGESRDKGGRFLVVPPLSITYKIDAKNRIVTILQVTVHRTKH